MYQLYIANKNYSSWSLRPWVLMRQLGIPFAERSMRFDQPVVWEAYRRLSPSGKVPCLVDGDTVVWDSLSICEYLAERHAGVWPADPVARAWARSGAAEMHSGFTELRQRCSMSCGVRVRLTQHPAALAEEIARLDALWSEGISRYGGPFLAGAAYCAVDAFFAPVVFRIQSYGIEVGAVAAAYVARSLALEPMRDWYAAALAETFRDQPHEAGIAALGTVLEDFRSR